MAGSVNKVILVGNLGKDPEIRSFGSGSRVANFSIATSESWKDKATGEKKERTEWHRIVVWPEQLVGIIEKYVKKGTKVYIEGQIETRKYEKDGREVYTTEIVLRPFTSTLTILDSKGSGGGSAAASTPAAAAQPAQGTLAGTTNDMDDEIPF